VTKHIDLFNLFTVKRQDVESHGGVFAELINPNNDGVVYLPLEKSELVNETLSKQPIQ
jgi:hypothetical protein